MEIIYIKKCECNTDFYLPLEISREDSSDNTLIYNIKAPKCVECKIRYDLFIKQERGK